MHSTRFCSKCQEKKPLTSEFFGKKTREVAGLSYTCKVCQRIESRRCYQKRRENGTAKTYAQQYYTQNKDTIAVRGKEYYQQNKNARLQQTKLRRTNKHEEHLAYRRDYYKRNSVIAIMRSGLRASVNGRCRTSHSMAYVGCSVPQLKEHIASQFQPGMTWENYGRPSGDFYAGWHIDHIRPLALFKFDELNGEELERALHEAWHYSNLQPLWALENVIKSDTWPYNQ